MPVLIDINRAGIFFWQEHLEPLLSALLRMMLANYLGRKGRETCLKGVVVFSAGWDVFECTASLEKPLDRFLFNSYLTSCLQASVHRSARKTRCNSIYSFIDFYCTY